MGSKVKIAWVRVIAIVALVVGVAFLAVVTWAATEAHYANCINAVEARTPLVPEPTQTGAAREPVSEAARLEERVSGIDGCSHWPF
jgi:hypothetical protein